MRLPMSARRARKSPIAEPTTEKIVTKASLVRKSIPVPSLPSGLARSMSESCLEHYNQLGKPPSGAGLQASRTSLTRSDIACLASPKNIMVFSR